MSQDMEGLVETSSNLASIHLEGDHVTVTTSQRSSVGSACENMASVDFTADLHSMGQYIQEGKRLMFETVVRLGASNSQVYVPKDETDGDGLNFLAGESMDYIRDRAMEGTLLAHTEGGVPNVIVEADGKTPEALGQLIYFFEYACGLSGYLLDVNPFDQPGVEAYKKNMFALLGKPGYEDRKAELEAKLKK